MTGKSIVKIQNKEDKAKFVNFLKAQGIPYETFSNLLSVILKVEKSAIMEMGKNLGITLDVFEDFQMAPFASYAQKILTDGALMLDLAKAYRSGAMADDYREQYTDMARIIRFHFPQINESLIFAEAFYKENLEHFVKLDEKIVASMK